MSRFMRNVSPESLPGRAGSSGAGGCKYFFVGIGLVALGVAVLAILGIAAYTLLSGQPAQPALPGAPPQPSVPGPDIAFQEPAPGARLAVGESVLVFATARDANRVTRVDLWVDDQLAIQQTAPDPNGLTPFSLIHQLVATRPGMYALTARAYNGQGVMSESPVMYVTVFDQPVAEQPPATVQPPAAGQTPVVGQTPATVQPPGGGVQPPGGEVQPPGGAQPPGGGVQPPGGGVQPPGGGVQPVPVHPPLPKPPPVPPIGWLPGLAPNSGQVNIIPGLMPGQPGASSVMIMPELMPGMTLKDLLNPPNARLQAPELITADVKGCTVTITWKDTSGGKATFDIARDRLVVTQKMLATDAKTYTDNVPHAGTYVYEVVAFAKIGADWYRARSNPKQVVVPPAADCIPARTQSKLVYFQPTLFEPGGMGGGALLVTVGKVTRRMPPNQGESYPEGDWSWLDALVFPAPESLYGNAPSVQLEVDAIGLATSGSPELGGFGRGFPLSDLKQNQVRTGTGQKFILGYRFWVEDMKWTGQGTTDKLPAPTNLRFTEITASRRTLQWDWSTDQKDLDMLDVFYLYRAYSCPGEQVPVKAPRQLPKGDRKFEILAGTEPAGCIASYQVSAYGLPGESATSNTVTGSTTVAIATAQVTFKDLTVANAVASEILLFANDHHRRSKLVGIPSGPPLALDKVEFNGQNNTLTVNLTQGEFLSLSLDVQQSGCRPNKPFSAPAGDWSKFGQKTEVIEQKDSQGNVVCKMTVEIKVLDSVVPPPAPAGPGGAVPCPAPVITFAASPPTIDAGKTSTLSWTTTNAKKVEIDQGIGDVTALVSKNVNPQTTTTYTLTATGCDGKQVTKQAKVEVKSAAPPSQADAQIVQLLAGSSNYWVGEYWMGSPIVIHYASFCFYKDGRFNFYLDRNPDDKGKYRLATVTGSGETYLVTFQVTNDGGTETYEGILNVTTTPGREKYHFFMQNGPPEWKTISYAPAGTCQ